MAENASPPSPNFPDFTPGKTYVSLAVDPQSGFTLNPKDISFDSGVRAEFVSGLPNIREKVGFGISWKTMDPFDLNGDTFHTLKYVGGWNTAGGFNEYAVMRNDGYYFYHYSDDAAPRFFIKFPLKPGMRWSHDVYHERKGKGTPERQTATQHYYADAEETIQTPAGTFQCVRVLMGPNPELFNGPNVITHWYAKGFGGFVQVRIPDGRVYIMKAVSRP